MEEIPLTRSQIDEIAELATRRALGAMYEAQIDAIAEKAARRALEIVAAEVGRGILKKLAWIVGIVIIGLALWLAGKNSLPLEPR